VVFGLPPRRQRPSRYGLAISTAVALVVSAVMLIVVLMWAASYRYP
jgi:hypothetical protein